jgi:carboxylesterase
VTLDFELINEKSECRKAVLLFHGLTGSPFELKKYGQFLYKNGYDVYADCLPGHGDKVEEIYTVKYTDWLEFAYKRFEDLNKKYDEVFVSGLCLGAVLALAVAIKYKDEVKGIVSLSTTLFLDGWRLPWFSFLMPIALSTMVRFYYNYPECEPHGIKNLKVRNVIKRLLQQGNVGMNDFPMTSIFEMLKLSKFVRKNIQEVTQPILIIHSQEDDLTSTKSAKLVNSKISSTDKEMIILKDSYHMVLYDNEKEFVYEKALSFLDNHSEIESEGEARAACC